MVRLFLYWLPFLVRRWWWALLGALPLVANCLILKIAPLWMLPAGLFGAAVPFWRYWLNLYRFGKATWRFRKLTGESVVVRYAPELNPTMEIAQYLQRVEEIVLEFSRQFGFPLRRRLVIFLFTTASDMSRIFKAPMGGCAFIGGDAIALGFGGLANATLEEVLRHELAHLFSAYLGTLDPPLKGEGLATWLMGSVDGKPVDFHALAFLLTDRYLFLTWLTQPTWFFASQSCYYLAGSFTGHLIRRFGWDSYKEFFRRATAQNFDACFAQTFGCSLLTAERQWRDELLKGRQNFEPELTVYIGERQVEAAFYAGHVYRCLEACESLARIGHANGKVLWYAATTHYYLGQYDQAVPLLEQVVQTNDAWIRAMVGEAWVQLGNLHDLLGQRDKATSAYQHALAESDNWSVQSASTHSLARHYLTYPFTEQDLRSKLTYFLQPPTRGLRRLLRRRR
jgi:tetratricopeptide (TPR) repeat protein